MELWSLLHRWKLLRRVLLSHRILVIILNSWPCFVTWGHYLGVCSKGGVERPSEALHWLVISLTNVIHLGVCCGLNVWLSNAGPWSLWGLCYRYFHFILLRWVLSIFNVWLRLFWAVFLCLPSFKLLLKLIRFLLWLLNDKRGYFRPLFALWSITVKSVWLLIRCHLVVPTPALRWAWLIFEQRCFVSLYLLVSCWGWHLVEACLLDFSQRLIHVFDILFHWLDWIDRLENWGKVVKVWLVYWVNLSSRVVDVRKLLIHKRHHVGVFVKTVPIS